MYVYATVSNIRNGYNSRRSHFCQRSSFKVCLVSDLRSSSRCVRPGTRVLLLGYRYKGTKPGSTQHRFEQNWADSDVRGPAAAPFLGLRRQESSGPTTTAPLPTQHTANHCRETSKATVNGHTVGSPRSPGAAEARFSKHSRSLFDSHCNTHGSAESVPPATLFTAQVISRYSPNRLPTSSEPIQPYRLVAANWDCPPTGLGGRDHIHNKRACSTKPS